MAFCSGLSHPSRLDLDFPTSQGVVRRKGLRLVWQLVHDPLFPRPLHHFLLSLWHHHFLCLCLLLLECRCAQKNLDTVQVVQGANACNHRICSIVVLAHLVWVTSTSFLRPFSPTRCCCGPWSSPTIRACVWARTHSAHPRLKARVVPLRPPGPGLFSSLALSPLGWALGLGLGHLWGKLAWGTWRCGRWRGCG